MTPRLYFHPATLTHDPGPFPGMGPARLNAVRDALEGLGAWHTAAQATPDLLGLVHTGDYIDSVLAPIAPGEERAFDFETFAMSGTAEAALYSAGLVAEAVRAVVAGEAGRAFCLVSPGGHHAEADTAQGFCFFNHVAMAAAMAQAMPGVERVAVLDFDAHHGNGTQSLFWNHERRLLVSLHEETGLSGFAHERGSAGNVLNIPLPPGSGSDPYRRAMVDKALPKLAEFAPDLLIVSAGFDMHRDDPLASMRLETADYAWTGAELAALADTDCAGRVVAVLEGGYNLDHLGACAAAFVSGLKGSSP